MKNYSKYPLYRPPLFLSNYSQNLRNLELFPTKFFCQVVGKSWSNIKSDVKSFRFAYNISIEFYLVWCIGNAKTAYAKYRELVYLKI
jgi:hypothetical protein